MSEMVTNALIGIATTFFGAFSGWFFTRKKYLTEVEKNELDNVEKATAIWRNIAESLKTEIDELRKNQDLLKEENMKLWLEVRKLEAKEQMLTRENVKLKELIEKNSKKI